MKDTSPEMETRYHELLMGRSGLERLKMACSMFEAAKAVVKSAILDENPGLSKLELKKKIFLRFYGLDLSESQKQKIIGQFVM